MMEGSLVAIVAEGSRDVRLGLARAAIGSAAYSLLPDRGCRAAHSLAKGTMAQQRGQGRADGEELSLIPYDPVH